MYKKYLTIISSIALSACSSVPLEISPDKSLDSIVFAVDSHEISQNQKESLLPLISRLKDSNENIIELKGYADVRGDFTYNADLSIKRAKSIMRYIEIANPGNQYLITGMSESDSNCGEENDKSCNRVVTIEIK